MTYRAPVKDMLFAMRELAGIDAVAQLPGFEDAGYETAQAVLEECAKLNEDVVAPLNQEGDIHPSAWQDGEGMLHLVVTDMVLPEMNGRDLVARLQRERPGLLALFTSGYAHGVSGAQSLAGAPYLPKPFTPDLLLDKVRSVLEPRPAR